MATSTRDLPIVYAIGGIAESLRVTRQRVQQLYRNGRLPDPDLTMIEGSRQRPLWNAAAIEPWIKDRLSGCRPGAF